MIVRQTVHDFFHKSRVISPINRALSFDPRSQLPHSPLEKRIKCVPGDIEIDKEERRTRRGENGRQEKNIASMFIGRNGAFIACFGHAPVSEAQTAVDFIVDLRGDLSTTTG